MAFSGQAGKHWGEYFWLNFVKKIGENMAKATFSPAAQFYQALISVKQITVIECC